jgi:ubiquinol-cytochrome c reductase cytochrome b subunit
MPCKMRDILHWFGQRLPIDNFIKQHFTHYYLPSNLNVWYLFGFLGIFLLLLQILSGVWLMMFYTPTPEAAFNSLEMMMREVPYGWLLRYLHTTGASFFFIVMYCHIFRSLLYGSYKKPRELVWIIGVGLYIILLVEAFMGYLLPWGQMSYWASQVATSLFAAIPLIGPDLILWLRGNFIVSDELLHRFFALHTVALPLLLLGLVWLHLTALRHVGSNNPDGKFHNLQDHLSKKTCTMLPFHPYYTIKELLGLSIFLLIFFVVVFFAPDMWGYFLDPNNFIPANPLQTPSHIVPLWYFAPFYAMLCAIPHKMLGIIAMASAVAILFILPWLDKSFIISLRHRSNYSRIALAIFILGFILLAYLGMTILTPGKIILIQILTVNHFLFFCLMPIYTHRN